jgi:3',5'-cyclic AMP phosphodiesterase CpdA
VWNDTHEQAETLAALRRTTAAFAPDALVVNGDVPHDQFRCIQDLADNFLNPTKGATGPQWPVIFVRGNHDARGVAAHALPRFAPTSQPEGYVNLLRYGPIGIIILDTGEDKDGPDVYGGLLDFAAYRRTQYQWLERAAADQRFVEAPFRLVFCHIPLRWKNPASRNVWCEDGDTRWSPVLAKAKVQAVISGHTHQFWHDPPTPARPFHQVTGGGPEITSTRWSPTPATVTQVVAETGVLTLRVVEAASGKEHLHLQIRA